MLSRTIRGPCSPVTKSWSAVSMTEVRGCPGAWARSAWHHTLLLAAMQPARRPFNDMLRDALVGRSDRRADGPDVETLRHCERGQKIG